MLRIPFKLSKLSLGPCRLRALEITKGGARARVPPPLVCASAYLRLCGKHAALGPKLLQI